MKVLLRKIIVFVLVFFYTGISVLSISLPVGAQSKKGAKRGATKKKGGSKSSKSGKSKTNQTGGVKKGNVKKASTTSMSKSSKLSTSSTTSKTSKVSKTRKATSNSSKRTLASKRRNQGGASRNSRRANVVRKTIGKSLSFLNQLADNTTVSELECINSYVDCMDEQIEGVVGKFKFLDDDEAVEYVRDTGQPFRCVFYDPNSVVLKKTSIEKTNTGEDTCKGDACTCIGNACYTQRGINELYNSYNYYCSIERKLRNNIGRKINQCKLETASSFATKYSVAYYNEVLERMEGDGLQMINLENSTIYKNLINQLNLKNESSYVMDGGISSQIMNQLNLEEETELFSVNVVPPVGTSAYLASAQFNTASNKCFPEGQEACKSLRSNLERYYLTGKWEGVAVGDDGKQVEGATSEDITSAFFSAKESCSLYEQALISTRDKKYGEFDNKMQNWIEENIAKMISKKIKTTASYSKLETSMVALDQKISLDLQKAKSNMELLKAETESNIALTKSEIDLQKSTAAVSRADRALDLAKTYASAYSAKVLNICNNMISNNFTAVCGKDSSNCFSDKKVEQKFYTWGQNINQYSIKLNKDGDVIPSHKDNKTNSEFANYISYVQNGTDKNKKDGYYQVYCKDVTEFDYRLSHLLSLPASVATFGEDVKNEVKNYLETQFPIKKVGDDD